MMKTAAAETNVELNVKFKDGLKEIEAFCNKIFTKKDIFGIINLIDASYNYFNEVQGGLHVFLFNSVGTWIT